MRSTTTMILLSATLVVMLAPPAEAQRWRGFGRGLLNRAPAARPAPAQVTTVADDQPAATHPGHFALIIAVREYSESSRLSALPGTNRDAQRLAAALRKGGYPAENIVIVHDDAEDPRLLPTRTNIQQQLSTLMQRATHPSNLVAVFATGHGVSMAGDSYFCPSDATDAAIFYPAAAKQQLISVRDVAQQLSTDCKATKKMLVIDACRDVGAKRTDGFVAGVADLEKETLEGVWLISSCSAGQFSWMSETIRNGERTALFSHYLAEGLRGAADLVGDNDGEVGFFELYTYCYNKTKQAAEDIGEKQTPELFGLASPFPTATIRSFVAKGKLTTSDPDQERQSNARSYADRIVQNLRAAAAQYRKAVTQEGAQLPQIREHTSSYHRYLCYVLGNNIRAAIELDADCKLAHLARGMCYRTCGMYQKALEGFVKGGEHLELFVKADPDAMKPFLARDESGGVMRYPDDQPVPRLHEGRDAKLLGAVDVYAHPGDLEASSQISGQAKIRIADVSGDWLMVAAVNDEVVEKPVWIHTDDVHWFPEAVDLYTPSTPMRPLGGAGTRFDHVSSRLSGLANRLSAPADRLELAAMRLDVIGNRIGNARMRVGAPIARINGVLGRMPFAPTIPNYPAHYLGIAEHYARLPANYVRTAAAYARIPAIYVETVGGYAELGGNIARTARGMAGHAYAYDQGYQQNVKMEDDRNKLAKEGKLEPVEERPIRVVLASWRTKLKENKEERQAKR